MRHVNHFIEEIGSKSNLPCKATVVLKRCALLSFALSGKWVGAVYQTHTQSSGKPPS